MSQIIVVGGGIMGLSCAIALAADGHSVTVLDASAGREAASWGNAGHIATEQVAPLASRATLKSLPRRLFRAGGALDLPLNAMPAWAPFAWRMLAATSPRRFTAGSHALGTLLAGTMPAWRRLTGRIGRPELLSEAGHLMVWESPRSAARGKAAWTAADIGTARIADPAPEMLATLRTLTDIPIAGAIRFEGTGQVRDLGQFADALEKHLQSLGGTLLKQSATLTMHNGRAAVGGFEADVVLIAAGAASGGLMAAAGHRVPIIAERGYHIRADAAGWPADIPPIVFEDRSMIVTRYAGQIQAASFVEFNRLNAPPDPRKWQRLEHHVRELGLPFPAPISRWMGARPTLPDYLPAIGRSRRAGNLFYAFGHQHLGLTLAPVTGEIVAALVRQETPSINIRPFDIERFGGKGVRA